MIPCLFHCPRGAPKQLFRKVVSHFITNCEMPKSPTVDVITYNNGQVKFPLEIQVERLGLKLYVVAKDFHPWSWVAKITEPKKCLESLASPEQLVMLVDGNDTIFTRPPYIEEITRVLRHYGSPAMLFCPTCSNWPPNEECRTFERGLSMSPKPHLSAGAYVGTMKGILEGLEWIEERRRKGWLKFRGRFDDQLAWRRAHLTLHPKLAIDTEGLLFNRFDQMFLRSIENENMSWIQALRLQGHLSNAQSG
jgi:hypothetical protein